MKEKSISLVDYGIANLLNVKRAFEYCGATVTIIEEPGHVTGADRLVVPGVGSYENCINEINQRGFADAIHRFCDTGRPMLGICVGMQILFDASEEFGEHQGLGILPGRVKAIPNATVAGESLRVPHIGWNELCEPEQGREWEGTLLEPFSKQQPAMYFVHSFSAHPQDESDRLADCIYGGHRICAAVQRDNIMATQFHPERSGENGLAIVQRFLYI